MGSKEHMSHLMTANGQKRISLNTLTVTLKQNFQIGIWGMTGELQGSQILT
jgi:hypothetical protein